MPPRVGLTISPRKLSRSIDAGRRRQFEPSRFHSVLASVRSASRRDSTTCSGKLPTPPGRPSTSFATLQACRTFLLRPHRFGVSRAGRRESGWNRLVLDRLPNCHMQPTPGPPVHAVQFRSLRVCRSANALAGPGAADVERR
jgi:hypothetical protein